MSEGPLIVQSDKTLLLEVGHPQAAEARVAIAPFTELERAPEHVHTYRITPLGLWNARAAGGEVDELIERIWDGTSEIQRHIISRDLLRPLGA